MGIQGTDVNLFIGEEFVRVLVIHFQKRVHGALSLSHLLTHDAKGKRQSIQLLRKFQSCLLVLIRISIWHTECQEIFGSLNNRERRQIQFSSAVSEFQTPVSGGDKQ